MTRNVTCASMVTTDGFTTVYGIYRARLHRAHLPVEKQYIDLRTAEQVGREIVRRGPYPKHMTPFTLNGITLEPTWNGPAFDYLAAARKYETPRLPCVRVVERIMTRRERLERKLTLRQEWSEKAGARARDRFDGVHNLCDRIPLGQPILVGHHSEGHARADQRRIENGMRKGCEESALAKRHDEKAHGIARQLDRSVFSDDPDAIEQIEARIAENTKTAEGYASINRIYRKGGIEAVKAVTSPELVEKIEREMRLAPWQKLPFTYHLTNLRARIRSDKERIATIRAHQQRTETATAAGGVLIEGDTYIRVTFSEKPDREILNALRTAGFRWGGGSWVGERAKLPADIMTRERGATDDTGPMG